jgi:hypothetical protein
METNNHNEVHATRTAVLGLHARAAHDTATRLPELSPRAQAAATAKYIDLVQGLGAELSYATGWRGEVAKRVGISGSLLSQILRGRKITRGTLEKAVIALKLAHDYFGDIETVAAVPVSEPPTPRVALTVDPLLVLESFKVLPPDTRRRLLALMRAIGPDV